MRVFAFGGIKMHCE